MQVKILEVRDRATFIPVMAILVTATNAAQDYLCRRVGFVSEAGHPQVILMRLNDQEAHCDPYDWADERTMKVAHGHIGVVFSQLRDGDVVDVEHILGETKTPKISERFG